jgi:hypothetical protein
MTVELPLPITHFHRASTARPGKSEVVRRRMRNAATSGNAPDDTPKSGWPIFQAGDAVSITVTCSPKGTGQRLLR